MRHQEESFTISRPYTCGMCDHGDWTSGSVLTKRHLVNVYTQDGHTRFDAVHKGRHHMLTMWGKRMTQRGMAIIAGRWSRKLAGGTP